MIEVLATVGLATVQDLGRDGSLRYGVGTAGAMDPMALVGANLLLGNPAGAAVVEMQLFPFTLRFTRDGAFALTGADCGARLADRPLLPWSAHQAQAGEELILGQAAAGGCRAYLALPGGIDVPEVLGSRSTQLRGAFGGLQGRVLAAGDTLRATGATGCGTGFGLVPPALGLPLDRDGTFAMRVLPAAEYHRFTPASRAAFWAEAWKITPQSDRYGFRLAGKPLAFTQPVEMLSHGIVPGVIQVPPSGQPIVQMRDAQPSGGYPKLGTVIAADLWRLGQAPVGSRVRFIETTWDEAVAADEEVRQWLNEAARLIGLARSMLGSSIGAAA
jgi:biotin-dependent carboxylase-like uncharacterized protein